MEQIQKVMKWNNPIHLELNKHGQYILPFSRRVININLPWLIKEQQPSSSSSSSSLLMVNHGKHSSIDMDVDSRQEKRRRRRRTMNNKDLVIIDKRSDKKYNDSIFDCPLDNYGDPDMSDRRAWHRLYDDYYDDDDDDDDSTADGQREMNDHIVNFTKFLWARYGKSIPEDFINPFEIYDE